MKYLRAMLIALLMPFAAAHAALMTVDSPLGPETAVLDTSTELEWLKVSITANTTPSQVFAEMTPGGRLQGFRYATADEFTCGLVSVQLRGGGCSAGWVTNDVAIVQAFLDLFGAKFNEIGLFGIQIDPQGLNFPQIYVTIFTLDRSQLVLFDSQLVNLKESVPASHWLVREAQTIPEPSTLALLGLGILGLVRLRKVHGA
jgi:hypothetical protein